MIPRHTVETLRQHKAEQIELKQNSGGQYKDEGIVFATKLGSYANGHNITGRTIKSICKKAGLPPMRFHDLRHTHGSLLAANSLSARSISDRLGHADASFTMKLYTHKTTLSQMAVVNVLDAFFG
jgi:integrase